MLTTACGSSASGNSPSQDAATTGEAGPAGTTADASTEAMADASSPEVVDSSSAEDASTDAGVPADAAPGTGCSGAATLCWGFEDGMTIPSGWKAGRTEYGAAVLPNDTTTHTGPALVADQTRPHWGKYSLHAKGFVGGTPGVQGGPKATILYTLPTSFGSTLWGRAFVYTSPAAPASHAGLFNARYPRPGSTATAMASLDWYEVASYTQDYMTVWHPPEPPGFPEDVQVSGMPVMVDQFACLEWLFDGAAGDGGQASPPRMWVDGTELSWPDSFTYPTDAAASVREPVSSFLLLETGVYLYQGLTTVTDWWIDDLAVGPARIGCGQ
jgi:hypothetical protein